jgi:hypothetical protein
MSRLKTSLLAAFLALFAFATPASATWSVVVFNRVTGECGVAVATCVPGFAVGSIVPVLIAGEGAGATQSLVGAGSALRIRNGLLAGDSPDQILATLAATISQPPQRQYGVVGRNGPPAAFTGSLNGAAALHRTGSIGDWDYSIQGNVLAGPEVVLEAELALMGVADEDAIQLLMAALETGRAYGGDGRCSCSQNQPATCGSPPPGFTNAATTAFVVVARPGDTDGNCSNQGCASGAYYLREQFNQGNASNPPVLVLADQVRVVLEAQRGRPDHFQCGFTQEATVIQAGPGQPSISIDVELVDRYGDALTSGVNNLSVNRVGDPIGIPVNMTDNGDGTYNFRILASAFTGEAVFELTATDANGPVQLWPPIPLRAVAAQELHAGVEVYSVQDGTRIPFWINRGAADSGSTYRLLGTASGTQPGTMLGGLLLPLNRDRMLRATFLASGSAPFMGFNGALDASGKAQAALEFSSGMLTPLIGTSLHFAALIEGANMTNTVEVLVGP